MNYLHNRFLIGYLGKLMMDGISGGGKLSYLDVSYNQLTGKYEVFVLCLMLVHWAQVIRFCHCN